MARRQGGTLSGFTPLSTPNAPTGLSVSASIGSAEVSFTAPTDTGDGAITSYVVTAVDESTGASSGATGTESPISISPGGGTFKIRMQALNNFGPGRLTEFDTGNQIYAGAELYAWGTNSKGQLGDGTVANKSSPVQVGSLTTWAVVSTRADSQCSGAIKTDGTLWTWGDGIFGSLGQGSTTSRSSPVQVGALTNWSSVTCGVRSSAAIKTDGTLWAWGSNGFGQLGTNNRTNRNSPVQVGALTDWLQVSMGGRHCAAVKADGTLWSWGANLFGSLGDGTTIYRSSPVQIGALTNWSQVSTAGNSYDFSAAVKADGTLWSWGSSQFGNLGHGDRVPKSSPVQVGALTVWAQTDCGLLHCGAVKSDGTLWMWGDNALGKLGLGDQVDRSSPVQVGSLTDWSFVSCGYHNTSALKSDGTLWNWGRGSEGQLGTVVTANRSSPVQVGSSTDWYATSCSRHTLAIVGVV